MSYNMTEFVFLGLYAVSGFFILYLIGYSTFLFLAVVTGSSMLYKRKREERLKNTIINDYYIPVSIVVPAYNEEVTVVDTVKSLLQLEYISYEIVVVDDGSTDETSKTLIDAFNMHLTRKPIRRRIDCKPEEFIYETIEEKVPITLIRKKNGGKADALNMGINASAFPYFICMDADSVLQYDSLKKITGPILENDNVVAVGGSIRASNNVELENGRVKMYRMPKKILAGMQVLEYDRSFLASRILFDKFNGSLIISGAFGLFKKELVMDVGGYDLNTMGEDMELVVKIHDYCRANEIPYLIKYSTEAICWTQVPERIKDLFKQRKRWHLGLFQSLMKHRRIFFNLKYGMVSFVSYMYFLIYELLSPIIELLGIATMIVAFYFDLLNMPFMILFLAIYAVFGSVLSLTSFFARVQTIDLTLSLGDVLKAVVLCVFEVVFLRFALVVVRFFSFVGYKENKLHWGKIKRVKIDLN